MKRRLVSAAVTVAVLAHLALGLGIYFSDAHAAEREDAYADLAMFSRVLQLVRRDYVDGQDLSYRELIRSAVKGMLGTLDPHSEFLEPQNYEDLKTDTEGEFGGLGITVSPREGGPAVVAVIDETPAAKAGIAVGDIITAVAGEPVEQTPLADIVQRLRGRPGTTVKLTLRRPATGEETEHELTRAIIPVWTVLDRDGRRAFPLLGDGIGYLRIVQFGEKTGEEVGEALKKLKAAGMRALVLDLRDNPGGLLEAAVEVAGEFLPPGQLVVSTEGRHASQQAEYRAAGRGRFQKVPLAVLVNGSTASAAEIVAGSFKDVGRARLFGEQTFGKGSVQSILPLPDGTALRLTTAKYYTPAHEVIHEQGITPHSLVALTDEEVRDLFLQRSPGGLDSLPPAERERAAQTRDLQLDRAVDYLRGIMLLSARRPAAEAP
ncbi:MAG: S41 family peptidase [Limisphaerales bacterium]